MAHDAVELKMEELRALLAGLGPCAVAFSAGVDSTLLLAVAHEVAGDDCLAITASTPAHTARELAEARAFCAQHGIRHVVFEADQLQIPELRHNPVNRCYVCKRHLFAEMAKIAREQGHPTLLEGSNADDQDAYRPGFAAVEELGVRSPLLEAGLTKADVRAAAKRLGLDAHDKPSSPCLLTRFAYGQPVTHEGLRMVEHAEEVLHDMGVASVRVRMDGQTARIEAAPANFPTLLDEGNRLRIVEEFTRLGFAGIVLDLQGYRSNDPIGPGGPLGA